MAGWGEVAEKLRRSTVQVRSGGNHQSGSGVIWTDGGLVITNAHVLGGERAEVELWDGRTVGAHLLINNRRRDLAALRIEAPMLVAGVQGDSSKLRSGELVIAVGNPLGFVGAVSTGTIHSVQDERWVVSSIRLAPGNSGGPLANARGEIVGINTMLAGGLGLAVPVNAVQSFLKSAGTRTQLGVVVRPLPLEAGRGLMLLVLEIVPGSPAERASLWPGDVIVSCWGRSFRSLDDFAEAVDASRGNRFELQFRRGYTAQTRTVVLQLDRAARAA